MYGTVARFQLKPGTESQMLAETKEFDAADVPGAIGEFVYRMDNTPNEYYLVVIFESAEAYKRNAASPEQDARYRKLREFFAADPEWHDGEIIHSRTMTPIR